MKLDKKSFLDSLRSIKTMSKSKKAHSNELFDFKPFKIRNHSYKIAAVDGSNNNIQGINFTLALLRAGYLLYQDGELVEESISPIRMETLINTSDKEVGFFSKYREYYYELTKEIPDDFLEFDKVSERLRTLMEWKSISELVEKLGFGDVIIFDGSLISGAISTNHLFYSDLVSKAKENGVSLIGVSKDTTLSIDNVSIPVILREASKKQVPKSNWYVELEDTYFVRFTKKMDLIFRFDVVHPDEVSVEEVLSRVGAYAFSRQTLGYQFPMQRIHDKVRISQMDKENLFNHLKKQWIKEGSLKEFEELFFNYHKQLDIMSSGR